MPNTTPFAETKHDGLLNQVKKEAFNRGFVKAAMNNGCNIPQAATLLKEAESSGMGRYLAMKATGGSTYLDNPGKAAAGLTLGNVPYVNLLGTQEMLANRMMGEKEERGKKMEKSVNDVNNRTLGENTWHGAKQWAKPMSILGGLAGAGLAAYLSTRPETFVRTPPPPRNPLIDIPVGAALGTGIGALGGGLAGAAGGLINKAILQNTTKETQQRAIKMKNEHPYLTSLPFGDMIGAANA